MSEESPDGPPDDREGSPDAPPDDREGSPDAPPDDRDGSPETAATDGREELIERLRRRAEQLRTTADSPPIRRPDAEVIADLSREAPRVTRRPLFDDDDDIPSSGTSQDAESDSVGTDDSSFETQDTVDSGHEPQDTIDSGHEPQDTIDPEDEPQDTIDPEDEPQDTIDLEDETQDTVDGPAAPLSEPSALDAPILNWDDFDARSSGFGPRASSVGPDEPVRDLQSPEPDSPDPASPDAGGTPPGDEQPIGISDEGEATDFSLGDAHVFEPDLDDDSVMQPPRSFQVPTEIFDPIHPPVADQRTDADSAPAPSDTDDTIDSDTGQGLDDTTAHDPDHALDDPAESDDSALDDTAAPGNVLDDTTSSDSHDALDDTTPALDGEASTERVLDSEPDDVGDPDEDPFAGVDSGLPSTGSDTLVGPRQSRMFLWVLLVVIVVGIVVGFAFVFIGSDSEPGAAPATRNDELRTAATADIPTIDDITSDITLPAGPDGGLEVLDAGATTTTDRFDANRREATYAALVRNPADDWLAQGVEVTVVFRDRNGEELARKDGFIEVVLPSQTVAVAGLVFEAPSASIVDVDVTTQVSRWREVEAGENDGFEVDLVDVAPAEFGGVRATATITSTFDQTLHDVVVTAVFRTRAGDVLGGYNAFVEAIEPGVPAEVVITLLADVEMSDVAETEIYATAGYDYLPPND